MKNDEGRYTIPLLLTRIASRLTPETKPLPIEQMTEQQTVDQRITLQQ
jgi:hypothetical protein